MRTTVPLVLAPPRPRGPSGSSMMLSPRPRCSPRLSRQLPVSRTVATSSPPSKRTSTSKVASPGPYACSIALPAASQIVSVISYCSALVAPVACRKRARRRRSSGERTGLGGQRQADQLGRRPARAHGQERHVVAGIALAEHRLEHPSHSPLELVARGAGRLGELVQALLERHVAPLHQAVGVEQQRGAGRQRRARLAEHGRVGRADRHRAPALEEARRRRGRARAAAGGPRALNETSPVSRSSTR